ncbi:MAG: Phosphate acetyltransferase [Chlamydiales bacterium]|nr:Phosphate acetyltransferase [Chlamydiales bacterium]
MSRKAIFVAATGQNVGKTTICLGMIAALKKKFPKLGFMKPVGQQHVCVGSSLLVDKDVVLFKEHFNLPTRYEDMSPVIFPRGFTREYLDGKVDPSLLKDKITISFAHIQKANDFTIVEGTGHVGVGSIVTLNNATVAAQLGLEVVIIAKGGLGSAFDELALNKTLCDQVGVKIAGVILNRVIPEKNEMILTYITKALKRWNIPLIGSIPYNQFLSTPSMEDFENLFKTRLISGESYHYSHFETMRLIATSVETFKERLFPNQLIVTPATREDIIRCLIDTRQHAHNGPEHGLILTGQHPPHPHLVEQLKQADIPSLYAAYTSFDAMKMITSFIAKIRKEDSSKVEKAIELVESHLDLSKIL